MYLFIVNFGINNISYKKQVLRPSPWCSAVIRAWSVALSVIQVWSVALSVLRLRSVAPFSRSAGQCLTRRKGFNKNIQTTSQYTIYGNIDGNRKWPAEQRIQYATLMLYHNIKNSDEERKIKKMIEEQEIKNYNKTFYKKVASYSRYLPSRNLWDWNRQTK